MSAKSKKSAVKKKPTSKPVKAKVVKLAKVAKSSGKAPKTKASAKPSKLAKKVLVKKAAKPVKKAAAGAKLKLKPKPKPKIPPKALKAKTPKTAPKTALKKTVSSAKGKTIAAPPSAKNKKLATPAAKTSAPGKSASGKPLPQGAMPRVAHLANAKPLPILARPHQVLRPTAPPAINPALADNWKTKSAAELSDDEVLAMPMSEYMNEKQREFFERKLNQLRSEILSSADTTTGHLREDTSIVPDPADRATIEEEHALELRTRDRERKLLKKIEQAMERLKSGEYGFCEETGEEIGIARLLARPTATLSLAAQEQREMRQRMYGETVATTTSPA